MITPVRILIADDHHLIRDGVRAILEAEAGWTVCGEASTGPETIEKALELQPDVILLDYSLPGMNGLEVTRHLRRSIDVPILLVTMIDDAEIVQQAVLCGATGYLHKADAGRTLVEAVTTILSRRPFISERLRISPMSGYASHDLAALDTEPTPLTPREGEVLRLIAEGRANKEVASSLGISVKTAETHRARIMKKLDVHSITELVRYAIRNCIIEP